MKRLGSIRAAGARYAVVEGTTREFPQLEDSYGICEEGAERILLRGGMSANRFGRTLAHEALHPLINESGAGAFFKGDTEEERTQSMEDFIRVIEPHLWPMLVDLMTIRARR